MSVRSDDLNERAAEIEAETDYDAVVICAGDSVQNRVAYGFERDEDRQPFREIVGTVSTCLHLILHEHFMDDYLSAYLGEEE